MRPTATFFAAALTAVTLSACGLDRPAEGQAVPPELKLEGVRFRVYRGGDLRTFGEAETATLLRDSSRLQAQGLDAVLPREGEPVRFSAPQGEGALSARTFEVTGGVLARRGEDSARTDRARYAPAGGADGLVRGDDPVEVQGPGYRLTGQGFVLDPGAGRIALRGGARLVAGLPGGR